MNTHKQLSDKELEDQMENCLLDPSIFNHEAHLRLAFIKIRKYGLKDAESIITHQLRDYVTSLGAEDKYNETLTIAAIKIVHHFMQKNSPVSFEELIKVEPRLLNQFRHLIASHYGFDIFDSAIAKSSYLEPDLLAF